VNVRSKYAYYMPLLMLLVMYIAVPANLAVSGEAPAQYNVFASKYYPGIVPLGMFKQYVIGIEQSGTVNNIVAVNVYNDLKLILGTAEGFGLFVPATKFWKTDKYIMLTDGKLVVIWDERMSQVGRFAQDNLKGVVMLPNSDLVAWSREVVSVARAPGYVNVDQYDVWSTLYMFFRNESIEPKQLLAMIGVNVDEIERKLYDDFMSVVNGSDGIPISFSITYRYDLEARTSSEARSKLLVDIVAASVINSTILATNVELNVIIKATGTYKVTTENTTETRAYENAMVQHAILGALVIMRSNYDATIAELYGRIEAGAAASVMAYVYEPIFPNKIYQRALAIVLENGTKIDVPVYTSSVATNVYLAGGYEVVHTQSGVTLLYRMDKLVSSFVAAEVKDIGLTEDGRLYLVYMNSIGAVEVGTVDKYSGRYDKYTMEVKEKAVGAYISDPLLFLCTDARTGTLVYAATAEPLATVIVNFVDAYGNRLPSILRGTFSIKYREVTYTSSFNSNPLVLTLPVGTKLSVEIEVPYGRANYSYYISETRTYIYEAVVRTLFTPGGQDIGAVVGPFYNPFYREFVIIKDSETLKYRLPGARSIDSYGSVLAMIEASNELGISIVSLYRNDGLKIYSLRLPGVLTDVKIYYPYMVVSGYDRIYVLDAMSGQTKAEVRMYGAKYDIDVKQDYFVAWSRGALVVVDLRRQTTTYMDMSKYGTVLYATVVNGVVYSYVIDPNNVSSVYVINPSTMGINDVIPWGGVRVLSYATDGVFHAVTYQMADGEIVTDVISAENGLLRMPNVGSVIWVKSLGRAVNAPSASELKGNEFAVLAVLTNSTIDIYVVGMNYVLVSSIAGANIEATDVRFSTSFFAVAERHVNATPVIVLKDYSGASRVAIITSTYPALFTVSESMVTYGNADEVFLIPNPKIIGKYQIEVKVFDERRQPLEATLYLKEFNIEVKAAEGTFRTYLSTPGVFHIVISAPFYKTKEVVVAVNDTNPAVVLWVSLEPQLFTLRVEVVTPELRPVKEGTLTIRGVDVAYNKTIDLAVEQPIVQLKRGTYRVEYYSPVYTSAFAEVKVENDTGIYLQVNRTFVRVNMLVIDEAGSALSGVTITVEIPNVEPVRLTTDSRGAAFVMIPYGVQFNVTASKSGYSSFRKEYAATEVLEAQPLRIQLVKTKGFLTIVLQDEDGKPETGTVLIKDVMGNVINSLTVSGTASLEVDLGVYTVEGTTSDGRTASAAVMLTEDMPFATATLTFPKKPEPSYVRIYPYLIIAVAVASAGVIAYRRFFRKTKPKVVK